MGREYDISEWLEFLNDDQEDWTELNHDEIGKLKTRWETRIRELIDSFIASGKLDSYPTGDADIMAAYLTYATFVGYGVGLWEKRESWHAAFWEHVKADAQLLEIGQELENEGVPFYG